MNIASFFGTVALAAWLAFVGILGFVVLRASREHPLRNGGWLIAAFLVVAVIFSSVSAGMVFINPDERGIVISALQPKGYREEALTPGLRWVIPFFESVKTYPIGRQTYTMSIAPAEGAVKGDDSITARTADGQELLVDASIIFAIDPNKIINIHIFWKDTYVDNLIRPQARGAIRDVISQYGVQDVVSTKRLEMTDKIRQQLDQKLSDNGLVLIDFIVRNLTFSTEYAASVEQKQIAEQQAQQAKFVVESKKQEAEQARQIAQGAADAAVIRAKGDADARVIQADAEAKALNLIASALKDNPDLLSYQYITKLAPNTQVMLLPNNAPFLYSLPGVNTPVTTNVPLPTVTVPTVPATQPTAQPTPTGTKTP
jgi:regulator of protease activity HflC (stomatin/prohibitin superfamily)